MPSLNLHNKYTYEEALLNYFDCRKHKRMTGSALSFELNFEYELHKLLNEVNNGSYEIGPTRAFVVTYPKAREVWAALFRDRIVHHFICNDIVPYFESRFIEDSYSCIKGKGTLAAVNRCEHFMRKITQHWSKPAWILQMDIKSFFMSINKNILWDLLAKHIGESNLTAQLTKQIIFHDPVKNPIIDPKSNFSLIKQGKSLWHCPSYRGLPIGNLSSQTFANVYLNELDQYVKHKLRVKYYARYVDDCFIIHKDREKLYEYQDLIDKFLQDNLLLRLNRNKTVIKSVYSGVTFLGNTILPYRTVPSKRFVNRVKEMIELLFHNYTDKHTLASLNSYLGLLMHKNTYNLRRKLCYAASIPTLIGTDKNYSKLVLLAA